MKIPRSCIPGIFNINYHPNHLILTVNETIPACSKGPGNDYTTSLEIKWGYTAQWSY